MWMCWFIPPLACWEPVHCHFGWQTPVGSTRCRPLGQPCARGTPSPPPARSHHRAGPASAAHSDPAGCWYSAPSTHTRTWELQTSHPRTYRSHPAQKEIDRHSRVNLCHPDYSRSSTMHPDLVQNEHSNVNQPTLQWTPNVSKIRLWRENKMS